PDGRGLQRARRSYATAYGKRDPGIVGRIGQDRRIRHPRSGGSHLAFRRGDPALGGAGESRGGTVSGGSDAPAESDRHQNRTPFQRTVPGHLERSPRGGAEEL